MMIFIIVSCSDVSKMLSEKTEFERCIEANIEIIRESGEVQLSQIPEYVYNLELRVPVELLAEFIYQLTGKDEDKIDPFFGPFQDSLQEPRVKSNILAHFSLLQSSGFLSFNTQIHLENDDNFYVTYAFFPEYDLEEKYYANEIFNQMHNYSKCPAEGEYKREICLLKDKSTVAEQYFYDEQGSLTYAEYYFYDENDTELFKTEKDFLDHFSKNKSWNDYNYLISNSPTFRLKDLLETEAIEEDEFFKFTLMSSLMSSTDDDLFKVAKRVCYSQGIY